jgi:hypothetical protein
VFEKEIIRSRDTGSMTRETTRTGPDGGVVSDVAETTVNLDE